MNKPTLAVERPRRGHTVLEFAEAVHVSRTTAYGMVARGEIRCIKVGRKNYPRHRNLSIFATGVVRAHTVCRWTTNPRTGRPFIHASRAFGRAGRRIETCCEEIGVTGAVQASLCIGMRCCKGGTAILAHLWRR